jgi:hypothetical protein
MTMTSDAPTTRARVGELIYHFEGQLAPMYPIGRFDEGIRFHNEFEGRVVAGPFAGARIFGLDQFLLRPDGVGVIVGAEVIDDGQHRVSGELRGYVVPPPGAPTPPLDAVLAGTLQPPDVPLRVTGSVLLKTTAAGFGHLNQTTAVIEGTVNLATGRLDVEARAVEPTS